MFHHLEGKVKSSRFFFFAAFLVLCSCGQFSGFQTSAPEPSPTSTISLPTNTIVPSPRPTRTPSPTPDPTLTYIPLTWRELNVFLASDHTNWNKWITDKYTCVNFAMDLVANARKHNIEAWIVGVQFDRSETGHAFVAFETTDLGVVWIEPQSDYAYYAVEVGKPLCYTVDTSICYDHGKATKVEQQVECNAETSECWLP